MSLTLLTITNRIPGPKEWYYRYNTWLQSIRRFGVEPVVLGMGEEWKGLMTKPRRLRQYLRDGKCSTDLLLVTDSYDVVFTAPPVEIEQRYREVWPELPVVFNAEKGIFPRTDLADKFPDPGTPWRYLNSGLMIGPPASILKMLEGMWLDDIHDDYKLPEGRWVNPNDQAWMQVFYVVQPVQIILDTHCRLFQCLSECSTDDVEMHAGPDGLGRMKNKATGTVPLVLHFNGAAKNHLMPWMLPMLGL